jgi:hypothetical protein
MRFIASLIWRIAKRPGSNEAINDCEVAVRFTGMALPTSVIAGPVNNRLNDGSNHIQERAAAETSQLSG